MSLSTDQKEVFKTLFLDFVQSTAGDFEIPMDRFLLEVIPLTIQAGTDYLISNEKELRKKMHESKNKSNMIKSAMTTPAPKNADEVAKGTIKKNDISTILGKDVMRGPDWRYDDQDGGKGNAGKVISVKSNGWVKVRWQSKRTEYHYRWGCDKLYEVVPYCAEEESFPPFEEQIKMKKEWLLGKTVVRGRDWKWKDQDGGEGKMGVVRDIDDDDWVEVKWDNGKIGQYRWGHDGCFDLKVVSRVSGDKKEEEKTTPVKKEKKLLDSMDLSISLGLPLREVEIEEITTARETMEEEEEEVKETPE